MSDNDIHHLGAAYALDALDDRERQQFEAHCVTCETCRAEVAEFRATAAELGGLVAGPVPGSVRADVMAQIATTRQLSPLPGPVARLADHRRRRIVTAVGAAAAAIVLFVAGALLIGRGGNTFGDDLAALVADPTSQTVHLQGDAAGSVTVTWASGRAAVVAHGLPSPGDGRAYELWLIDPAGPHPMSLLDPAHDGTIERILTATGDPAGWGITIEPERGSAVPTPPVLYAAEV